MKPKISVVIAAYNEEKLLARSLQSLLDQDYPRDYYEIIVADNDSTDKTAQIAKSFGATVYKYTDIKKCGATRQFGAMKANAPIIAITDADAKAPRNWLKTIDELMKDPTLICVGGKILPIENNFSSKCIYTFYNIFHLFNQRFHKTILWGSNLAVRKDQFGKIGGFNTSLSTSDDWDLVLRLQKKFGKKSILYTEKMNIYTSTRRQNNTKAFIKYAVDGIHNYINIVLLGNSRSSGLENIR